MKGIGLDIGSTSIKGTVLDFESGCIDVVRSLPFPEPVTGLPLGHIEINPKQIIQVAEQLLGELIATCDEAESLWLSGQMGGVILADHRGKALSNYYSWRDTRTVQRISNAASFFDSIRMRLAGDRLASLGNELQAGSTSILVSWLEENGRLRDGAMPLSVGDFLLSYWCKQPGRMHETMAIGLLNPVTCDWHYDALEHLGLGDLWLPELVRDAEMIGAMDFGGHRLKVYGVYGDQQCALLGAGLERGQLSLNISTGSQSSTRVAKFQNGPYQTRKFFFGDWLNTVTHLPAGRSLNALVDLFSELARREGKKLESPWQSIARCMEEVVHTDVEADLAFFPGPFGDRGSFEGLALHNLTVGHFFVACCNHMVENYYQAAQRLDPSSSWSSIVLSGGLSHALPRLKEIVRSKWNLPIYESVGEETLLGLLKLGQWELST